MKYRCIRTINESKFYWSEVYCSEVGLGWTTNHRAASRLTLKRAKEIKTIELDYYYDFNYDGHIRIEIKPFKGKSQC